MSPGIPELARDFRLDGRLVKISPTRRDSLEDPVVVVEIIDGKGHVQEAYFFSQPLEHLWEEKYRGNPVEFSQVRKEGGMYQELNIEGDVPFFGSCSVPFYKVVDFIERDKIAEKLKKTG